MAKRAANVLMATILVRFRKPHVLFMCHGLLANPWSMQSSFLEA
jgi:hypothetical protein